MKKWMMVPVLVLAAATAFTQTKPQLGILPFTGGSGRDGNTIADLFANSRDLQQGFSIIPRTSVNSVMMEQQFQRSGLTDLDTIAKLGKQMNADYVVSGHIAPLGKTNLLLISIVHVQSFQQVAGDYKEYDRIEMVRGLLPSMAQKIITSIQGQNTAPGDALAVLPLDIQDDSVKQGDAEILAQILATEIVSGNKYAVFPRTMAIETVMKELQIQRSGLTDPEGRKALRTATNARYVLSGTITKLGDTNLFDVKILNIESGEQIQGADKEYTDLSDGIALMEQLAYEVTGVAAGRFADTRREIARQREQQTAAEKQQRVNRFLRGDDGKRFTSIGVNAGLGYTEATTTFMREYGQSFVLDKFLYFFANINATVPLSRNLFAEAGIDIGFSDPNNESPRYRDFHDKEEFIILDSFRLYRPYARLNIGIPVVGRRFLFLPYAGVGFDYWIETTKATYKYDGYNGYSEPREETNKSLGMDLVLGIIVNRGHHSWRMGANVSYHFDTDAWLSYQIITGYAFRF